MHNLWKTARPNSFKKIPWSKLGKTILRQKGLLTVFKNISKIFQISVTNGSWLWRITGRFKPIRKGAILGLSNNCNYNTISKRSVSPGVVLIPDDIRVQLLGVHLLHSYQLQPHSYKRNTTIKKYYDNYWLKTFLPYKGIYCARYSKKICVKETADYKDHQAKTLAK